MTKCISAALWLLLSITVASAGGNVIIAVIDGARYSETFGAQDTFMPVLWNTLRHEGTIYTNVMIDGVTKTCPGHSAMITGNWQRIKNDGTERPIGPTIFEVFRKEKSQPAQSCFVVSGKAKLDILTYGIDSGYGSAYGASYAFGKKTDIVTWERVAETIAKHHPSLMVINFPEVDINGHDSSYQAYLGAIRRVDSLLGLLWTTVQSDSLYREKTTLFITNDHGRHDDAHGGFHEHGDGCDGCRHIMLMALGPNFPKNARIGRRVLQIDLAPTAAALAGFTMPPTKGTSILGSDGLPLR